MTKAYSLRKCRHVFKDGVIRYKKLSRRLSDELLTNFERSLNGLDQSLANKNVEEARIFAAQVQLFLQEHGKKTAFEHVREFVIAIILALIIAALVRQMWFELYEIPSGSMRPTFRESDRVLVFKDTFCINKPFETAHFYFEPQSVKRGEILVLTGDGLDLPDVDTVYFGLFPGKRRYVKRLVAKDGDRIFFYGGKIYGVDKNDVPLEENPILSSLEYVPFITFEGKLDEVQGQKSDKSFILRHMNIPVAKIDLSKTGRTNGTPVGIYSNFTELWGIGNYAMSRLLEPDDLPGSAKILGYDHDRALLYLELKHSPSLPENQGPDANGNLSLLNTELSWIPLDAAACETLKEAMYTARFYVRKGTAFRYTPEGPDLQGRGVYLDRKIPDGCYEFIDGAAYEIGLGAITHLLPPSHPIYPHTLKMLKALYNSGIDISSSTNNPKKNNYFPARYAYYRDGSLYTLSKPLFAQDATTLVNFIEKEKAREKLQKGYMPFVDNGPPIKDGKLDVSYIKSYGLPIENGYYLMLGDNHAMSNDSRFFGAVPQKNLQGSPALLFWPPGSRWGRPPQPRLPLFRASNVTVVSIAVVVAYISIALYNRRTSARSYERARAKRQKK